MEEFSFELFEDLQQDVLHTLQINDYDDEKHNLQQTTSKISQFQKLRSIEKCIYTPVGGDTKLHHAIRCGKQGEIKDLLELYRKDFDKVRDHLVLKYQWNVEDQIWFSKTILVAKTEVQCRTTKSFEIDQINTSDLRRAVFVLLKYPVNGEEIAVIHPSKSKRLSAVQLIKSLVPNGFLTWNYVGMDGKHQTFMEASVVKGMHSVIDRLYELGAPIAIPGHNPLLTSIKNNRKETIKWLLTEHFDHFDCTLRDSTGTNALIAAMQRNDAELFDIFLEKMIAYRKKYFNESEEDAFHEIFRVELDEHSYTSIFNYLNKSGPIFERVEKAIQKYKLNLSNRWKHTIVLGQLIARKIAMNYCFEGIKNDPNLLGLKNFDSTTILHQLLRSEHLDFVREMYTKHSKVKTYFNNDQAFEVLRKAIVDQNRETIQFILEHHMEYLKSDIDKLRDQVVCCQYDSREFYETRRDLFVECFPDLRKRIEELRTLEPTNNYDCGILGSLSKVSINIFNFEKLPKSYSAVRGTNGETLLHWAVDKDDKELFVRLLKGSCELDTLDNDGNHPVHLVKSDEMLDLIIDRSSEGRNLVQRTNNDGCTVIHKVCHQYIDHTPLISLLEKMIEYGADVHQLNKHGESAVFFVGSYRLLDVLRKHGVQLDVVNNNGETALERHLCNGNICMVRPLFSCVHGLPSFKQHAHKYLAPMLNQYGHVNTYEYRVIFEEFPAAANVMLDSVYKHSREEASRLFSKACGTGFVVVVELFLDGNHDLDFNYKDEYGFTPILGLLNYMVKVNIRVIKRLLEKDVDLQTRCPMGRDALMYLIWRYRTVKMNGFGLEIVKLLLDHGASINTKDEDGNTPLHLAFQQKEMELVEFLVQNGANLKAVNSQGKRPLEMAPALERELFYFYSDDFISK